MVANTDKAQACGHLQNMLDNLRTQIIKFTDLKKVVAKC